MVGELLHYWLKAQEAVGHVEGDDAAESDVLLVQLERLTRNQVHRNRVAGESINSDYVIVLRWFVGHRDARVAVHDLDFRLAVAQICEVTLGDWRHGGVDVIEANDVARLPERRDRARA